LCHNLFGERWGIVPTQTFYNLPEEKKKRIIDAAIDEFGRNSFHKASVAGIVEKADIPRGSFYQYFKDMKDLYKYLFEIIGQKKLEYLSDFLSEMVNLDTFQTIKALYRGGIEFAVGNPELAAIGNNFYKESESFKQEALGEMEEKAKSFFIDLLKRGRDKGEVNEKVDLEEASFLLYTLNITVVDFFIKKTGIEDLLKEREQFLTFVDNMLYILENGLRKK
jgi:AcrR family transcriptional regulator